MILTAELIVEKYGSSIRKINAYFRKVDESHLWPINGRFNATERAIRKARKIERSNGSMSSLEYALFIESECSSIVNDPKNL